MPVNGESTESQKKYISLLASSPYVIMHLVQDGHKTTNVY